MNICTYNVRSLASTERYLELNNALAYINHDIIGLSEVRRMGCNIEEYENYIFCYIGQTKGLHGVGFLIKKKLKNQIKNFIGISERVALLQLKFEDIDFSIIQAYAPTEKSNKEEVQKFYNDIKEAHKIADNKVIVMGDFNAKIGHPKKEENIIMGNYGYGERNERGEELIDYALEYNLSIMNTFFKKRPNRKWTWISPDQKTRNEIDFIMTNNPKMITNYEVLSNVMFPSDHRLLRVTFVLNHPIKSRKNFTSLPRTIKSEEEAQNYLRCLTRKLESISEESNVQEYYNKIEESIQNSIKQRTESQHKKTNKIFSENTIRLIKERTELMFTKKKDPGMKKKLSNLFKETRNSIKKDYSQHRQEIITRNLREYRSTKRAIKELSLSKSWIQKLEFNKEETKSRKNVIDHATKFYKELYSKTENNIVEVIEETFNTSSTAKPIEEREVFEHIRQLKAEKSPGPDGLSNETLKLGAPILLHHLTHLFNMILDSETVPEQWCTSDIILLYKKGNPMDIGNYRPISLLASIYKLFSSILLNRIAKTIDESQPKEQAGFRAGFSTTDHIQTLDQIMEKYKEFNRILYVAFIDYSKAFDSISHSAIWNALSQLNVEQKYINIIKNIYAKSTSRVKLETKGDEIKIERGVRQGDPLSPKIFIAVLECIFRNLNWERKGISLEGCNLNHLRFADDIVLVAETAKELEELIRQLNNESTKVGLHMNASKTKIMTNSHQVPIMIEGKNIDYVNQYIYLGKQMSFSKSNNEEEVERRVGLTWRRFWSLKEILKGNYNLNLKKIVLDTCLLPSLLYGCQTWTLTDKIKRKIRTTQRAMERSILKIKKVQKIRSETIREQTKVQDALTKALKLKWKWAGHVARYKDKRWTLIATRWRGPTGKRNVGRPVKRWKDDIVETAEKDWLLKAKDREKWDKLEEAFTLRGVQLKD